MGQNSQAIWIALLTVTAAMVVSGQLREPLKVTEPFKISLTNYDLVKSLSEHGHIYGARECGGNGRVLEAKYDSCLTGYPAICSSVADKSERLSAVFVLKENIDDVVVRTTVTTQNGQSKSFDIPMKNINLIAGQTYEFTTSMAASSELKGKIFTGRVEVFSLRNYRARVCAEADFFVQ